MFSFHKFSTFFLLFVCFKKLFFFWFGIFHFISISPPGKLFFFSCCLYIPFIFSSYHPAAFVINKKNDTRVFFFYVSVLLPSFNSICNLLQRHSNSNWNRTDNKTFLIHSHLVDVWTDKRVDRQTYNTSVVQTRASRSIIRNANKSYADFFIPLLEIVLRRQK